MLAVLAVVMRRHAAVRRLLLLKGRLLVVKGWRHALAGADMARCLVLLVGGQTLVRLRMMLREVLGRLMLLWVVRLLMLPWMVWQLLLLWVVRLLMLLWMVRLLVLP